MAAEQRILQAESAREQERMLRVKAETQLESERNSVADKVRSQEEMEKALREQFDETKTVRAVIEPLATVATAALLVVHVAVIVTSFAFVPSLGL